MKRAFDALPDALKQKAKGTTNYSKVWKQAVGDIVAAVTTPLKMDGDKLIVAVHENIWVAELNWMKADIIEQLAEAGLEVPDIKFYYRFREARKSEAPVYYKDISEKEAKVISRLASRIEDENLRESYEKALRSYFTRYSLDETIK